LPPVSWLRWVGGRLVWLCGGLGLGDCALLRRGFSCLSVDLCRVLLGAGLGCGWLVTGGVVGDLLVGDFTRGVMLWVDEWLWVSGRSRPGMPVPEVGAR
jgi:hypothetical protein